MEAQEFILLRFFFGRGFPRAIVIDSVELEPLLSQFYRGTLEQ
jgi:hypothetical protein